MNTQFWLELLIIAMRIVSAGLAGWHLYRYRYPAATLYRYRQTYLYRDTTPQLTVWRL